MEELAEGVALADRYLLGPVVGHGAMGRVHLAEDLRLARPVAVKSLRPELARYPDVRQRFGQEARSAARINHPNVVRVYDSGEHGRIPYLVMECLPGSTLVDELAWGTLEPRRARRVGLDVLGALEAAHRMGVVHRDVKPGNILLSAALDGPVKVSDFGIAKSADDASLTDSGSLVGTPAYLAPERVAGGPATPSTDLYSLGVVLYEALAGRKPYEGETSLAVALAIHMGGAPSLQEVRPDLDPALATVIDRAIARHESDRWASAADMMAALRAWRPAPLGPGERRATTGSLVITPLLGRPVEPEPDALKVRPVDRRTTSATDGAVDDRPTTAFDDSDDNDCSDDGDDDDEAGPSDDQRTVAMAAPPLPTKAGSPTRATAPADHRAPSAALAAGVPGTSNPRGDRQQAVTERTTMHADRPRRSRRHVPALAGAGLAALLLVGALAAMAGRPDDAPSDAGPTTTAAELVAGPATSAQPPPEESTVAPVRPVVPTTARATRRTVAPATTATTLPPTTLPAPTTTAPPRTSPPRTTPPPTAPPTTTATTAPPTTAAPAA